jgi:hypothetical protein
LVVGVGVVGGRREVVWCDCCWIAEIDRIGEIEVTVG